MKACSTEEVPFFSNQLCKICEAADEGRTREGCSNEYNTAKSVKRNAQRGDEACKRVEMWEAEELQSERG